jgi:lysophospholipase L1-like esterase
MTPTLAILGDSIAFGTGSTQPSATVGGRLAALLEEQSLPVDVRVVAVPGARSADLAVQVDRALGTGPAVALIIIGANDLIRFVKAADAAGALGAAVATLTAAGCAVVVAPVPDMSAVPWVPPALQPLIRSACAALHRAQTAAALAAGARVADIGDGLAAFGTDQELFSADRFHPSDAGYALITDALAPAVLAARRDAAG